MENNWSPASCARAKGADFSRLRSFIWCQKQCRCNCSAFPCSGTPPQWLTAPRHCHSESCKWGCHILWLSSLYFIENCFKNCKQIVGLRKCITFPFLKQPQLLGRKIRMCSQGIFGIRTCKAHAFACWEGLLLDGGYVPQCLPNLVQQQIAHFHVCTFLPMVPKERASQDMHTHHAGLK